MAKTIKVQRGAKFRVKGNPAQTSQAFSAATSVRQVPAMIRALVNTRSLEAGHTNVDIGGGRFDDATDLLATVGVRSFVVDSGNRSQEHNRNVLAMLDDGRADSVTIANVLNVIPDSSVRREVLELARNVVRPDGRVYIDCYAGSGKDAGKGVGRSTSKGWQEYRSLASYLPEVLAVFPTAKILNIGGNRMIVASKAHHHHQQPTRRANPDRFADGARSRAVKKSKKFTITGVEFVSTDTYKVYIEGSRFGHARLFVYPSEMQVLATSVNEQLGETRLRRSRDLSDAEQKKIRAAIKKFVSEQPAKSNTGAKHLVAVSAGKVPQYVFNTDHWKLVERSAGNIVTRYNLSGPRGAKWRIDADTSFSSSDPRRFTYYRVS